MDDDIKERFGAIDQRLENMPKAIATAFVEAFANARTALAGDIQSARTDLSRDILAVRSELVTYRHETEQAAERRHGELMRALTGMVPAVPSRAEVREDKRFGELAEALEKLRAELAEIKLRVPPPPPPKA